MRNFVASLWIFLVEAARSAARLKSAGGGLVFGFGV